METLYIIISLIGLFFLWWVIWFYKKPWYFYIIAIPLFLGGIIAFLIFVIEILVDLYNLKNKEDEEIID